MKRGIVYVATGAKYYREACISAASIKDVMPAISITVFTDQEQGSSVFDQVLRIASTGDGFKDKIKYLAQSPYEHSLFLDTDTYLCADVSELFDLLQHFDIALAHDSLVRQVYTIPGIPNCFPEFNTAVIVYKNTAKIQSLFEAWISRYEMDKLTYGPQVTRFMDQGPFRAAIFSCENMRIATLTAEYNCMFRYVGAVSGHVKIVHGRLGYQWFEPKNLKQVAAALNTTIQARLYYLGKVYVFQRPRTKLAKLLKPWSTYEMKYAGMMFEPDWRRRIERIPRRLLATVKWR